MLTLLKRDDGTKRFFSVDISASESHQIVQFMCCLPVSVFVCIFGRFDVLGAFFKDSFPFSYQGTRFMLYAVSLCCCVSI